jgi:glutaminyl-tRNA synthetase
LGLKYNAPVNLRFDDTNPAKKSRRYVDAIKRSSMVGLSMGRGALPSDYFNSCMIGLLK